MRKTSGSIPNGLKSIVEFARPAMLSAKPAAKIRERRQIERRYECFAAQVESGKRTARFGELAAGMVERSKADRPSRPGISLLRDTQEREMENRTHSGTKRREPSLGGDMVPQGFGVFPWDGSLATVAFGHWDVLRGHRVAVLHYSVAKEDSHWIVTEFPVKARVPYSPEGIPYSGPVQVVRGSTTLAYAGTLCVDPQTGGIWRVVQ